MGELVLFHVVHHVGALISQVFQHGEGVYVAFGRGHPQANVTQDDGSGTTYSSTILWHKRIM